MGCFPFTGEARRKAKKKIQLPSIQPESSSYHRLGLKKQISVSEKKVVTHNETENSARTFSFRELAAATRNFRPDCLLGEGGFGQVYKGRLESINKTVAIKKLDRNGLQGNREFLVEVLMLSLLHHPNLVNLIGYCADGDQRLLVYEYMPLGSLENHLYDLTSDKKGLDWNTRMKIAAGAAKGLEYLHDKANPPVIYRDLKCSNILLEEGYHPKLSDFGLAKLGPIGDNSHVSTRVMGTYGYCTPEYAMTRQLTLKSDVYSFGVVLLELITGRREIDDSRGAKENNLVSWVQGQISLSSGGGLSFTMTHYPCSEFELMAQKLLMSDSTIKVFGTLRMSVKLLLLWNSRMLINVGSGDTIMATSLLESSSLIVLRESSVIRTDANLEIHGQGLLNLSGTGDVIEAQRLTLSLFYSIQ